MMGRCITRGAIAALLAIGLWQIGAGSYIHAKAWLAQHLIASAWSRTLAGAGPQKPWPWADTWPIARLEIAGSGTDIYVLADASGESLAFGPGHVTGTAAPGTSGHSMLAGHRDTHFAVLRDAQPGAMIVLETADGRVRHYVVTEAHVFDSHTERIEPPSAGPTLTLLTCYPFDALVPGGTLRYAAIAEPLAVKLPELSLVR